MSHVPPFNRWYYAFHKDSNHPHYDTEDRRRRREAETRHRGYRRYEGQRRGGHARAAVVCPRCHNPLDGATACAFCRPPPSTPDFGNADAAAREFLYRCGVVE